MKISAVVPTYNRARLLERAIHSILAQTRAVDEIVVVDDGSTDDTAQTIESFPHRICYVYQHNRGLAGARNTGIRAASGDWIALLDDDDEWLPDKIRRQEEALTQDPAAVLAYSGYWREDATGARSRCQARSPARLWPALRAFNFLPPATVLVRRDCVLQAGGFNERMRVCEDWDLWVRLRSQHRFTAAVEPLIVYHITPGSLSQHIDPMLEASEEILETTLLGGLTGWERRFWRRRIRASQLFSAAITAREAHSPRERSELVRSLRQWPSPLFMPLRYAAFARLLLGPRTYDFLHASARRFRALRQRPKTAVRGA